MQRTPDSRMATVSATFLSALTEHQLYSREFFNPDLLRAVDQTYLPDNPVIRAVVAHDRSIFTEHDLAARGDACYPPFVRLVNVVCRGREERAVASYIGVLAAAVRERLAIPEWPGDPGRAQVPNGDAGGADGGAAMQEAQLLGPTPCVIERAKDRYRYHFVVKAPLGLDVSSAISRALADVGSRPGIDVSVDVDAYDMM